MSTQFPRTIVVGFTGEIAAGKGVGTNLLVTELGFRYFSLSDRVREAATRRGLTAPTREALQDIGDEYRRTFGGGVWAKETTAEAFVADIQKVVIDGIRNPAEIELLRRHPCFFLVGVTAPREERFSRMLARGKSSDPKTWEDFLVMDARDKGVGQDSLGQQVEKCLAMAHTTIHNDGSVESYRKKLLDALAATGWWQFETSWNEL